MSFVTSTLSSNVGKFSGSSKRGSQELSRIDGSIVSVASKSLGLLGISSARFPLSLHLISI